MWSLVASSRRKWKRCELQLCKNHCFLLCGGRSGRNSKARSSIYTRVDRASKFARAKIRQKKGVLWKTSVYMKERFFFCGVCVCVCLLLFLFCRGRLMASFLFFFFLLSLRLSLWYEDEKKRNAAVCKLNYYRTVVAMVEKRCRQRIEGQDVEGACGCGRWGVIVVSKARAKDRKKEKTVKHSSTSL